MGTCSYCCCCPAPPNAAEKKHYDMVYKLLKVRNTNKLLKNLTDYLDNYPYLYTAVFPYSECFGIIDVSRPGGRTTTTTTTTATMVDVSIYHGCTWNTLTDLFTSIIFRSRLKNNLSPYTKDLIKTYVTLRKHILNRNKKEEEEKEKRIMTTLVHPKVEKDKYTVDYIPPPIYESASTM